MNHNYYYFSTHTTHPQIYSRLAAYATSQKFDAETMDLLDMFVNNFKKLNTQQITPLDYCSRFIKKHKDELYELDELADTTSKEFLFNFLGYSLQWKASTRSFGKNCKLQAHEISEEELIDEMTNPKASIKKLLDASGGNLSAVKPFLPAVMISLWTNTRDKSKMTYKHTGKFCFDFDKFTDKKEAIYWMKKVWSFKNINPYFRFISPRGKGFKIFCQVDISNPDFKADFASQDNEVVKKHHKVWYDGAMKEIVSQFPELKDRIDPGTNDPTRLTYIPFISNKTTDFKYDVSRISEYTQIVQNERKIEHEKLLKKISENQVEVDKIMKEQNITCQEEAYNLFLKKKSYNFDLEFEKEKFIKLIDFIEEQTHKDSRIEDWVAEKFNTYLSLQKLSWVLYGVFGEMALEQIKRLIPADSNKLDEDHGDYRWALRSMDDYSEETLKSLTPAPFYAMVRKLPIVNDFISENFGASSQNLSDFKILNDYYETYIRNKNLEDDENNQADLNEFLDDITGYVDKKKVRLPLIEEFDNLTAEITLGPNDYLDKDVMHDLFQNKYSDKRIFFFKKPVR
ncbi:BT4734/BF3469 family protein [Polaribacter atrinae]|uniref:BT4734/BF3469 family protein n=1 Tax=Polaribacter atrinae TaxID=1333662 RepID=UPI002493B59B|nr:BT4734/BF3469 family protein [Polaribacter atrinae]